MEWKQAYNPGHVWEGSDWQGASLKAYELLGRELGYQLVGTNFNGVNAFFVRQDLAGDMFITPATAENLYNPLRHELHFVAGGHGARYCLVGQQEGLGIRNYYEDGKIRRPKRGFKTVIRQIIHKIGEIWRKG